MNQKTVDSHYCAECGSSKTCPPKTSLIEIISKSKWWKGHDSLSEDFGFGFGLLTIVLQIAALITGIESFDIEGENDFYNPRLGIVCIILFVFVLISQQIAIIYEKGFKPYLKWTWRISIVILIIINILGVLWLISGKIEGWLL